MVRVFRITLILSPGNQCKNNKYGTADEDSIKFKHAFMHAPKATFSTSILMDIDTHNLSHNKIGKAVRTQLWAIISFLNRVTVF